MNQKTVSNKDDILRLDLDDVKMTTRCPSFVVFHDGRTVLSDDSSHGQTVLKTCRKYYPKWRVKFNRMVKDRLSFIDYDDMSDDERERLACMMVLNGEYLERNGFVLIHNILGRLIIFGHPLLTDRQIYALNKINAVFKISGWPDSYCNRR